MNDRDSEHDPFADVPELDDRLADWVDGCMSDRDRERFEAEMRVSKPLREQAEKYRATVDSMRAALQAPTQPVDLAGRVMERLAQEQNAPRATSNVRPWPLLGAILTAAALLGIAVWVDAFGSSPRATGSNEDLVAASPAETAPPPPSVTVEGGLTAGVEDHDLDGVVGELEEAELPNATLKSKKAPSLMQLENKRANGDRDVRLEESAKLQRVVDERKQIEKVDGEQSQKLRKTVDREHARGPSDVVPKPAPTKSTALSPKPGAKAETDPAQQPTPELARAGEGGVRSAERFGRRRPTGPSSPAGPGGRTTGGGPHVQHRGVGPAGPTGPATGGPGAPSPSGPGSAARSEPPTPVGRAREGRRAKRSPQRKRGGGRSGSDVQEEALGRRVFGSASVRLVEKGTAGELLPMLVVEASPTQTKLGGGAKKPQAADEKQSTDKAPEPKGGGGGAKERAEIAWRVDVGRFFQRQDASRTGSDDFFLGARGRRDAAPVAGLGRLGAVLVGSVRVRPVARAPRSKQPKGQPVEHDWLVEGSRAEVARFLTELRRLAKQEQRTCRGGEARIQLPSEDPSEPDRSVKDQRTSANEAEASKADPATRRTEQEPIRRVVVRFRFPSR